MLSQDSILLSYRKGFFPETENLVFTLWSHRHAAARRVIQEVCDEITGNCGI